MHRYPEVNQMKLSRAGWSGVFAAGALVALSLLPAFAADGPKSPEQFAAQDMAAFNAGDFAALKKMRYNPGDSASPFNEFRNAMIQAGIAEGVKYSKYSLLPPPEKQEAMGPDGKFYGPNLKITNLLQLSAVSASGKTTEEFPIGQKDGIYYEAGVKPAADGGPAYQFGWQRFTPPKSAWSVMLPNEPEPGRAALEKQFGENALKDPDIYGVVQNTAAIKTSEHWFQCGEEGKRTSDAANKEIFRAAVTTYAPETLKHDFSDVKKNLDDAVETSAQRNGGKLVQKKDIDMSGSPGREFEVRDPDGTYYLGRVYWIKDSLYKLTFESKEQTPNLDAANKFLSSLQIQ
jgi:hypothetical protein